MAQITFTKKTDGTGYEYKGSVNADFNLHLEVSETSLVSIKETTVSGTEYAKLFSGFVEPNNPIDSDWDGIVYPKYIHIESQKQPTKAYITLGS